MYESIRQINRSGMTVVMVSHDPDAALRDASHILHLGGGVCFFGTAADYTERRKARV
jgi:zinc transport system ATP-binding protein